MTFRSQIEPSIKSYGWLMFFAKFRIGNHSRLVDYWKTSINFFLSKNPKRVKIRYKYHQKKQTKKLFVIDIEVFFSPKMKPHKIAFKNQLEAPINSYKYFKFE